MSYKKWLYIAVALFGIGLVPGLLIPIGSTGSLSGEVNTLEELAELLSPLPQASLFIFIFIKNISVILISFVLSPVFCLIPVVTLIINGGVIGLVSATVIDEISITFLLAGLLPHGVLEIPALIMGEAVALSFGMTVTQAMFDKEKRKLIVPNLRRNSRYMVISLSLFLGAAIVETYITPLLLN